MAKGKEEEQVFIAKQKDDMGNKAPTPKIRMSTQKDEKERKLNSHINISDDEKTPLAHVVPYRLTFLA